MTFSFLKKGVPPVAQRPLEWSSKFYPITLIMVGLFLLYAAFLLAVPDLPTPAQEPDGSSSAPAPTLPDPAKAPPVTAPSPAVNADETAMANRAATDNPAHSPPPAQQTITGQDTSYNRLPDEKLITFKTLADMEKFLARARKLGLNILGHSAYLLTVRLHSDLLRQYPHLLEQTPPDKVSDNHEVFTPDTPDLSLAPPMAEYDGFNAKALSWLDARGSTGHWGTGVLVAVLDTGIESHPALQQTRTTSISLLNEDTGDGSYAGHGTAVAAIIAGQDDQIQGIAPAVELLAIQVLDSSGKGDSFTVAQGILTAADRGADIINLSLGSYADDPHLRKAVQYALDKGITIVASTGNDGVEEVMYPARYDGVIAVGAVDSREQLLAFSNIGKGVDITAPGYEILTAWSNQQYTLFSGTSAAAPFVTGTIAGLLSENPGMTAAEAARITTTYTNDTGAPGTDPQYGSGLLNLGRIADRNTPGIYDIAVAGYYMPEDFLPAAGESLPLVITVQNRGTEYIDEANILLHINGQPQTFLVNDLAPNESTGIYSAIFREQIPSNGIVTVTAASSMASMVESVTTNNNREEDFFFLDMCPYIQ